MVMELVERAFMDQHSLMKTSRPLTRSITKEEFFQWLMLALTQMVPSSSSALLLVLISTDCIPYLDKLKKVGKSLTRLRIHHAVKMTDQILRLLLLIVDSSNDLQRDTTNFVF